MNKQEFSYLINNPTKIDKEQTKELENVITSFPYFQSARALYLKGLKNEGSFKYNQTLKITASYTTDQSKLFNLITTQTLSNNDTILDTQVVGFETLDISQSKLEKNKFAEPEKGFEEILEIGKPLEFKSNESHSFNEWLQLGKFKPIIRDKSKKKQSVKFDIIDKFIAANPKIKPIEKNISENSTLNFETTDYSNLMTETLAQVYLEQKKYKNAIKAYQILSLKYPEKSGFFADRIKAIKLLENK